MVCVCGILCSYIYVCVDIAFATFVTKCVKVVKWNFDSVSICQFDVSAGYELYTPLYIR